jgi:hypothetical protein
MQTAPSLKPEICRARQPIGHDSLWAPSSIYVEHTKLMLWTITGLHWLAPITSTSTCHRSERCIIGAFVRSRLISLNKARMRGVLHFSNRESTCRTCEGWSKSYKKKCNPDKNTLHRDQKASVSVTANGQEKFANYRPGSDARARHNLKDDRYFFREFLKLCDRNQKAKGALVISSGRPPKRFISDFASPRKLLKNRRTMARVISEPRFRE